MLPRDNEVSRAGTGAPERLESQNPRQEISKIFSDPIALQQIDQRNAPTALTREGERLGSQAMIKNGGLVFDSSNNILAPQNSIRDIVDPRGQQGMLDKAAIMGAAQAWAQAHPGEKLPAELQNLVNIVNPKPVQDQNDTGSGASHGSEGGGDGGHDGGRHGRGRGRGRHHEGGRRQESGHQQDSGQHHGGRHHGRRHNSSQAGDPASGRDSGPRGDGGDHSTQSSSGNLDAGGRMGKIYSFLRSELGLSKAQASGVIGNFMQEVGKDLNPATGEKGGHGFGLAQWTGKRRHELEAFAKQHGGSSHDLDMQLQFLKKELTGSERGALAKLKHTNTAEEAALSFSRHFERPGKPANRRRVANAREVFNSVE